MFNSCVKLHWYQISSYWNMVRRGVEVLSNWPPATPSSKTNLKKPSLGLGFDYCRLPSPKSITQFMAFRPDMSRENVRHDTNLPMIGCSDARCWLHQHILFNIIGEKLQPFLVHCCNLMNQHGIWLFLLIVFLIFYMSVLILFTISSLSCF